MKLTVIGAGNMSTALVDGIVKKGVISGNDICVTDLDDNKLNIAQSKGIQTSKNNLEAAKDADVIIIAVKPNVYPVVVTELSNLENKENVLFVSIAPGITIEKIKGWLGFDAKVIRTMPNTPAMVGEGMTIMCYENPVTEQEYAKVRELFEAVGDVELMNEKMLNSVVALTSSSPAYVYMFIEAMADAAVYDGIPRSTAYKLAAQAVLGSAKMVLDTGKHPGELKDMVCSPAGTTIRAVKVLEEEGMRAAVIKAMNACTEKANNM